MAYRVFRRPAYRDPATRHRAQTQDTYKEARLEAPDQPTMHGIVFCPAHLFTDHTSPGVAWQYSSSVPRGHWPMAHRTSEGQVAVSPGSLWSQFRTAASRLHDGWAASCTPCSPPTQTTGHRFVLPMQLHYVLLA